MRFEISFVQIEDLCEAGMGVSLRQARKNFLIKRACKDEFVFEAGLPMEMELDGINWIIPSNFFLGFFLICSSQGKI